MAPAKSSYLIFTKSSEREPSKILLELFGEKIPVNESPTFLGIRFDPGLTFKNKIDYLKECVKRMNILKIVSCKKWGLSIETRLIIYNVIIDKVNYGILSNYSTVFNNCKHASLGYHPKPASKSSVINQSIHRPPIFSKLFT
jgi:hypothetical protein